MLAQLRNKQRHVLSPFLRGRTTHNHRFVCTLRVRQAIGLNFSTAATTSPARDAANIPRAHIEGVFIRFGGPQAHADRPEGLPHICGEAALCHLDSASYQSLVAQTFSLW